jgi:23S rRNA (guanosine2251-2'-O)-methyltransferase
MTDLLYGRNAVREALRAGRKIMRLMVAEIEARPAAPGRPGGKPGQGPAGGKPGAPPRGGKGGSGAAGKGGSGGPPWRQGGRNAALPAQDTRADRRTVMVAGRAPLEEIIALARKANLPVERVPGERLDKLTNGANHQGVAAVAAEFHYLAWPHMLERIIKAGPHALVLVLDSLQDPQNFGTLLRTAEAVGITGVIMPEHRAVGVTPAVCNASSGAVEWLHITQVPNLSRVIEELKANNVWTYALAGDAAAAPYGATDLRGALALVVGSEGQGVSALVRKRCDGALALPMRGHIESLNAAVAGSVVLYEAVRQRQSAAATGDAPDLAPSAPEFDADDEALLDEYDSDEGAAGEDFMSDAAGAEYDALDAPDSPLDPAGAPADDGEPG